MKKRVYEILEVAAPGDWVSQVVDTFIMLLIVSNVAAVILGSVESVQARYEGALLWFEIVSVLLFTAEYLMRLWACTLDPQFRLPLAGRLRYALTPLAVIDLIAIAPFYAPLLFPDLRALRVLRLLRILRLLKFGRYSQAFRMVGTVVYEKREELAATFTVLVALLVLASSLMYEAERTAQPEQFSSIPAAMWWAVVTLTTVGYGDVFPVTGMGRFLGAIIAVLGIGMVALPTGIVGSGFVEFIQTRKEGDTLCPHCGKPIGAGR